VANVTAYNEWFIEKDILGFLWSNLVALPVFVGVVVVPVEPHATL
jgi:hypothetical protein